MAATLDSGDLDPDPIVGFQRWFDEAGAAGEPEPEAMALATSSLEGVPAVRFVLLRGVDDRGFVFYTNLHSRKGREMAANATAALAFRWYRCGRQVRVAGTVSVVDGSESDRYFAGRGRGAQLGAWASAQSEPIASRADLDARLEEMTARFAGGDVPRPAWWGGFRVWPTEMEFWQNRPDRLHDRFRYHRSPHGWSMQRLNP